MATTILTLSFVDVMMNPTLVYSLTFVCVCVSSVRRGPDGEGRPRQQRDGVRPSGQQPRVRGHFGAVRLP